MASTNTLQKDLTQELALAHRAERAGRDRDKRTHMEQVFELAKQLQWQLSRSQKDAMSRLMKGVR